ncbi:hypothetical protein [Pollutibacter soli]|uniref:hypothetical protein n=1 Tax=Pollutibacter soli TaxID=3034157 RepID=UPI0030135C8D
MKKIAFLFTAQTWIVLAVSLLSAYISLTLQLNLYVDFLILGLIIAFPLNLTIKLAFKRREQAIKELTELKATLKACFFFVENLQLPSSATIQFTETLRNSVAKTEDYLTSKNSSSLEVEKLPETFLRVFSGNKDLMKEKIYSRLLSYVQKIDESILFLVSVKKHHTPYGVRLIVLLAIYIFTVFYPASLLHKTGFDNPLWYVFVMTAFKGFILISLFNIQVGLEDSFTSSGPDKIKLKELLNVDFLQKSEQT